MVLVDHQAVEAHFLGVLVLVEVAVHQAAGSVGIEVGVGEGEAHGRVFFRLGLGELRVGHLGEVENVHGVASQNGRVDWSRGSPVKNIANGALEVGQDCAAVQDVIVRVKQSRTVQRVYRMTVRATGYTAQTNETPKSCHMATRWATYPRLSLGETISTTKIGDHLVESSNPHVQREPFGGEERHVGLPDGIRISLQQDS